MVAGVGGQEEGLQELLGRWKALDKRVRPEMILETMILSTDILGVAWQSKQVTSAGVTGTEFQTPFYQPTHWAELGLSGPQFPHLKP